MGGGGKPRGDRDKNFKREEGRGNAGRKGSFLLVKKGEGRGLSKEKRKRNTGLGDQGRGTCMKRCSRRLP